MLPTLTCEASRVESWCRFLDSSDQLLELFQLFVCVCVCEMASSLRNTFLSKMKMQGVNRK